MTAEKLNLAKHLDFDSSTNSGPYGVSSPFSLPPYDSLSPIPLPQNGTPSPYCVYPLIPPQSQTPSSPSSALFPPPILPIQSPPPSPTTTVPSPPYYKPGPPSPPYSEPGPPSSPSTGIMPTPPASTTPSPTGFFPGPPVFLPPIVYPPPTMPPPRSMVPSMALWCVVKPSVPDPIIQEAMNYACGSGADCDSIQPNGSCFEPNTLFAHASYAFNSYWQMTKGAGGTCEFGGTAMLVTVDPSKKPKIHFFYEFTDF